MKKLLLSILVLLLSANISFAKSIKFVQISDVLYGQEDTKIYLDKAIKDINQMKDVSFVVFTGDNLSSAKEENLKQFTSHIKKLNKPFYVVTGDKDVSKSKRLPKELYAQKLHKFLGRKSPKELNYTFTKDNILFIVADGSKDFITMPNGYFPAKILNWVEDQIKANPNKKVVVLQHFPLANKTSNEFLHTANAVEYIKMLNKYNNVISVVSGHFNINDEVTYNGIYYIVTPSLNRNCYKIIEIDQDNGYQIFTSLVEMD